MHTLTLIRLNSITRVFEFNSICLLGDIEKQLHIIFKDKRYKKEWFKLEKEDLKGIQEIFFEINNKLI